MRQAGEVSVSNKQEIEMLRRRHRLAETPESGDQIIDLNETGSLRVHVPVVDVTSDEMSFDEIDQGIFVLASAPDQIGTKLQG